MSDRWPFRCSTGKSLMTSKAALNSFISSYELCSWVWVRSVYLAPYIHTHSIYKSRAYTYSEASKRFLRARIIVIIEFNRFYIASNVLFYLHIFMNRYARARDTPSLLLFIHKQQFARDLSPRKKPYPYTGTIHTHTVTNAEFWIIRNLSACQRLRFRTR